jgi:uncharacterized membrane protein
VSEPRASLPRALSAPSREDAETEFSRIVAFTDGVFAIAITLLVLTLEVPTDVSDLGRQLREQWDEFFAYGLSFAVLGSLWIAHHRFFGSLARFDGRLVVLNLVYLAFIALVPFSSDLLGNYSGQSVAVILYAANLTAVTLAFALQTAYAHRRDLVRDWAKPYTPRLAGPPAFLIPFVFLASIPVALVSPRAALVLWIATFFADPLGDRIAGMRLPK